MKTVDISGFGGGYEAGCQKMLLQGLRFLRSRPDLEFDWNGYSQYKGITGICSAKTDAAKQLDEAVCAGVDPSGAMHQAVINHLAFIHQNGYAKWIDEAEKKNPKRVYETTEEAIDHELLISQIEWQLQLAKGFDPTAELFKSIPPGNVIEVDWQDPESVRKAARRLAELMKEKS